MISFSKLRSSLKWKVKSPFVLRIEISKHSHYSQHEEKCHFIIPLLWHFPDTALLFTMAWAQDTLPKFRGRETSDPSIALSASSSRQWSSVIKGRSRLIHTWVWGTCHRALVRILKLGPCKDFLGGNENMNNMIFFSPFSSPQKVGVILHPLNEGPGTWFGSKIQFGGPFVKYPSLILPLN